MTEMTTIMVRELAASYFENPDMDKMDICASLAILQIRKWLIDPVLENNEENVGFLCFAAAAVAHYYYILDLVQKQPSGEFSANGVSAKSNFEEQLKKAKLLMKEHIQVASHLINIPTSGFAFLSVEE
jgi:hypothetical protein